MSNNLLALTPTLYSAAKEVASEPFGIIDAINATWDDKGVAKGAKVGVPVAPVRAAKDFEPGAQTDTGDDATADEVEVEITHSRKVDWNLTGEQIRMLQTGGTNQDWVKQLVAQGMRTLRNEAEASAALAARLGASRAVGVAGTTPFASSLGELTAARKILQDNGAPRADLQLCIDSNAGLNMRNLGIVQDSDKAGSPEERRTGNLQRQFGFQIRESAGIEMVAAGNGSGYLVNESGLVSGATSITTDTGSGAINAGNIVSFAGHTDQYVVGADHASNSLVLNDPGLRSSVAEDAAITVGDDFVGNLAFERSAVVGIMRPPVMPSNPTIQQVMVSDKFGMTYLMLEIAQYGQISWELHLAWGFKAVNGQFMALVLG